MICPHCERSLAGHDDAHCRSRISRRFFFGLCVAPLAAKITGLPGPKFSDPKEILWPGGRGGFFGGIPMVADVLVSKTDIWFMGKHGVYLNGVLASLTIEECPYIDLRTEDPMNVCLIKNLAPAEENPRKTPRDASTGDSIRIQSNHAETKTT